MKTCDVCRKNIEFWEGVAWVHLTGVFADSYCEGCARSLQGQLDELERADPEIARAAKSYRDAVQRILRRPIP